MILFAYPEFSGLARELYAGWGLQAGDFAVSRFANQELEVSIDADVTGSDCLILGSVAPPDERLLSILLLAHTIKHQRSGELTLLLPYLAYTRQDKIKPKRSLAARWMGALLQASGVDRVITVDIHSHRAESLLSIPVVSLSPAPLFSKIITEQALPDATLVAPDEGAVFRCEALRKELGLRMPLAYFTKTRTAQGVTSELQGEVGEFAVVVDDILDTGETLVACCQTLQEAGAKEILVLVTHGIFTGNLWTKLWGLGVKRIYVTDTIPQIPPDRRIKKVSVAPLIRDHLLQPA
ncbi:MAG TPA: ribose-phosphate diphosphokinase [Verrucomicrobiae bacterium]|nr:ribose-phosphate diphosphokinase [Verrucomicrobiae bacterium]